MAVFAVSLAAGSGPAVSLDYRTVDGVAVAPGDYGHVSGSLVVAPGGSAVSVSVSIVDDAVYESDEAFTLVLESADAAVVVGGDLQAQATITDNDEPPAASIAATATTAAEGLAATLTVSLSAASGQSVTVYVATSDGTATASVDYGPPAAPAVFAAGQTEALISIPTIDDDQMDADEYFYVDLTSVTNATAPIYAAGEIYIVDND